MRSKFTRRNATQRRSGAAAHTRKTPAKISKGNAAAQRRSAAAAHTRKLNTDARRG